MDQDEREVVEERPRVGGQRRVIRRRLGQGLIGAVLIVVGVAGGVIWSERRGAPKQTADRSNDGTSPGSGSMPSMPGMPAKSSAPSDEAVEVSLTPEAIERAGIKTAVVGAQSTVSRLTVPGTVTSHAYRDTKVNALVGGVVRQVSADL